MQIDYNYVPPAQLTAFARNVPDLPGHTLRRFLPDRIVDNVEVLMDRLSRSTRAARFRAYDGETPIGRRPVASDQRVKLPPIGEKRILGEQDQIQLRLIQGTNPEVVQPVAETDTEDNVHAIYRRIEMARGDVLIDGKFTIVDENGLEGLEADFGLPGSHNTAPTTAWSDHTNAVPLDDLRAWSDLVVTDAESGEAPAYLLLSRTGLNHLRLNVQLRNALGGNGGAPASLTASEVEAVLSAEGLPVPVVYDTQATDYLGNTGRIIPADRAILLPATPIGYTAWGITAESLALVQANALSLANAGGVVAYCMTEGDALRLATKATAVAMPVIEDPRRMLSADIF